MTRKLVTYDEKRRAFRRFLMDIDPAVPVGRLTPAAVLTHLSRIAVEISGDRANRQRGHLTEAWQWGAKYLGLPASNPFEHIDHFAKGEYAEKYVPPEKDFWAIYDIAQDMEKVMLSLLYYTACRRGEVHDIAWKDVDLDGQKIRLGTRKGRSGSWRYAWIAIPDELTVQLNKHKLASKLSQPSDRVITGSRGGYVNDWSHLVQKLCRKAHVPEFGYHGIRHMVATKLWKEGHTVAQIQQLLRHESPQTTEIYLKSLGLYQTTEQVVTTLVEKKRVSHKVSQAVGDPKR
jgi:integrase